MAIDPNTIIAVLQTQCDLENQERKSKDDQLATAKFLGCTGFDLEFIEGVADFENFQIHFLGDYAPHPWEFRHKTKSATLTFWWSKKELYSETCGNFKERILYLMKKFTTIK